MKKFKGFTLTELMIALTVIGVLTAVVTPAVMRIRPNKNKMMTKKAYYITEHVVSSLLNDSNFYTDESENPDATWLGFDVLNSTKVQGQTIPTDSDKKFPELFMSKLNVKNCPFEGASGSASTTYSDNFKVCSTSDGMTWYIPKTTFGGGWTESDAANKNVYGNVTLFIDVNGSANGPNCRQNGKNHTNANSASAADCDADNFDMFGIEIKEDGRMQIPTDVDSRAAEYIEVDTRITE
jgi:prepilin-type N-terminal cleavage/methylation domain-containing protein